MACKRPRTQDIVALKLEELKRKHEQLRKRTKTEQLQCASAKNSVTTDSVPPSKPSSPQTDSATLTDNLLCNTNQKERSTTTNLRAPHRLNGSSLSSSLPSDLSQEIHTLLSKPSLREQEHNETSAEIMELLSKRTVKEKSITSSFKSKDRSSFFEYCPYGTREDCTALAGNDRCNKVHFRRVVKPHTDVSLGDCSYLDTCRHIRTCKYVHYELDDIGKLPMVNSKAIIDKRKATAEWICCDVRALDTSTLGKFAVIMLDPPWDIHMELPYGTLTDDEMRGLNIGTLQDDGYIFLWVTGRAMELGRECLTIWGLLQLRASAHMISATNAWRRLCGSKPISFSVSYALEELGTGSTTAKSIAL